MQFRRNFRVIVLAALFAVFDDFAKSIWKNPSGCSTGISAPETSFLLGEDMIGDWMTDV